MRRLGALVRDSSGLAGAGSREATEMKRDRSDRQADVNRSGFPFALRVEEMVRSGDPRWSVLAREHPVQDLETGESLFADLLVWRTGTLLVIECKRLEGSWTFLSTPEQQGATDRVRARWIGMHPEQVTVEGVNEFRAAPVCPEAEYCVGGKSGQTTESVANALLRITRGALEQQRRVGLAEGRPRHAVAVPVIVTTRPLATCVVDPLKVESEGGNLTEAEIQPAGIVRFRKAFRAHDVAGDHPTSVADLRSRAARTVFVVHVNALQELLSDWAILPGDTRFPPWEIAVAEAQQEGRRAVWLGASYLAWGMQELEEIPLRRPMFSPVEAGQNELAQIGVRGKWVHGHELSRYTAGNWSQVYETDRLTYRRAVVNRTDSRLFLVVQQVT